jgi:cytochrome bd-type quinol oxidase subunit 1
MNILRRTENEETSWHLCMPDCRSELYGFDLARPVPSFTAITIHRSVCLMAVPGKQTTPSRNTSTFAKTTFWLLACSILIPLVLLLVGWSVGGDTAGRTPWNLSFVTRATFSRAMLTITTAHFRLHRYLSLFGSAVLDF